MLVAVSSMAVAVSMGKETIMSGTCSLTGSQHFVGMI